MAAQKAGDTDESAHDDHSGHTPPERPHSRRLILETDFYRPFAPGYFRAPPHRPPAPNPALMIYMDSSSCDSDEVTPQDGLEPPAEKRQKVLDDPSSCPTGHTFRILPGLLNIINRKSTGLPISSAWAPAIVADLWR